MRSKMSALLVCVLVSSLMTGRLAAQTNITGDSVGFPGGVIPVNHCGSPPPNVKAFLPSCASTVTATATTVTATLVGAK